MAAFDGNLISGLEGFALDGLTSDFDGEHPRPPPGRTDAFLHDQVFVGGITRNQPIDIRSLEKTGNRVHSFFDDFYNRIYILPPTANFGPIAGETTIEIFVWNAFLSQKTLTSITTADDEGVTLDGPATPTIYKALQFRPYEVTVTLDGPPEVGALYTFIFEGGALEAYLPAVGLRAKLWPFVVNWREGYRISYEFWTDIFTSDSGKEQRRALRATPRKKIEFLAQVTHERLRVLKRLLSSWQNKTMIMPEVTRQAAAAAPMAPGAVEMTLKAAAPWWMVEDANVCLMHDGTLETRKVASTAGNVVTFQGSTATLWPRHTKVHPGLSGILESSLSMQNYSSGVGEINVAFNVEPGSEQLRNPGEPAVEVDGREVMVKPPNWRDGIDVTFEHDFSQVDFNRGVVANFYAIPFGSTIRQAVYTAFNAQQAEELLQFFERQSGQLKDFYVPSNEDDIPLMVTAGAGTDTLRSKTTEIAAAFEDDTVHRGVAVFMKNGDVFYRYVRFVFEVHDVYGDDSVVQTDGTWPYDIEPADVRMICWMPAMRFATDTLTIEFKTDSVAETSFNMRTVENRPVDVEEVVDP